jgi:hypothetical protein
MEFDSTEWREVRNAKLLEWFDGNQSAVDFLVAVSALSELWDDLTDKDKEINQETIDNVFWHALVTLPTNEFFNQYKSFFIPLIIQGINAWKDSLEFEKGTEEQRAYALTLRLLGLQLIPMIVTILRGPAAARKMSVESWKFATAHDNPISWINDIKTK